MFAFDPVPNDEEKEEKEEEEEEPASPASPTPPSDGAPSSAPFRPSIWPALYMVVCSLVFALCGAWCLFWYPIKPVDQHSGTCLRANRYADYAVAFLPFGTPAFPLRLLVTFRVAAANASTVVVASSRVLQSRSIQCEHEGRCFDVGLFLDDKKGQEPRVVQIDYVSAQTPTPELYTALSLGLDGQLTLPRQGSVEVGETHVCFRTHEEVAVPVAMAAAKEWDGASFAASVSPTTGVLSAPPSEVRSLALSGEFDTPLLDHDNCTEGSVLLFPHQSASEDVWLGYGSGSASHPYTMEARELRRDVVELGRTCSLASPTLRRDAMLREADCESPYTECSAEPSLVFRRLATHRIRVDADADADAGADAGAAFVHVQQSERLETSAVDGVGKGSLRLGALAENIAKLLLMLLTASVTWVRTYRGLSAEDVFLKGKAWPNSKKSGGQRYSQLWREDLLVGMLALTARIFLLGVRYTTLLNEGLTRFAVMFVASTATSVLQLLIRYVVIDFERPLEALGGATSLLDVASTSVLAFVETPFLGSSAGTFDLTARFLCALLVSGLVFPRLLYACAASVFYANAPDRGMAFHIISRLATLGWGVHFVFLAVLLADSYATPFALSVSRSAAGSSERLSAFCFVATLATGAPPLLTSVKRLATTKKQM